MTNDVQERKEEYRKEILRTTIEIPVSPLNTQDQQSTGGKIDNDAYCARVPYHRVTNEVNLTMVLDPKVLQKERPNLTLTKRNN
jgi:hypothetical protein